VLNPFGWIRKMAAEAVVLGTGDGLRAITPEGEEPPADLADLRAMLAAAVAPTKALPAAPDDEPAKKGKR
jgi:hypothetical protein